MVAVAILPQVLRRAARIPARRSFVTALPSYDQHYINGQWIKSTGSGNFAVVDSNTGDKACTVPAGSAADADSACEAAAAAFWHWSVQPLNERKDALAAIRDEYKKRLGDVVDALCIELGCTRKFAERGQAPLPLVHWNELLDQIDHFR